MGFLDALFIWIPINLIIGAIIGKTKGRVGDGMIFAVLLGPIGWLIVLVGKDHRRKCPFCAEAVQQEAVVCPHCQKNISGDEYKKWAAKRYTEKLAAAEDPVEKWAREHPDEAEPK